ncbi:class 1 fructose-bisphosphatase [Cellvibrio fontiphilus]|uniref:Fructose-1,6-bisphosphatase class 1 n=1 Tax=Cellvibrio fontiphilus TaxID=1815559 RepID=A0ABV7FBZ7_9GAMM
MTLLNEVLTQDNTPQALIDVVACIANCCCQIAEQVGHGALGETLGATEAENVQGEVQKKLDIIANDLLVAALVAQGSVRTIASEEEEHARVATHGAPYIVAFDPLDGSSNIDVNGQIGTIFTVFNARDDVPDHSEEQFFQAGSKQICAGYVLYGPYTTLVISTGTAVHEFTLNKMRGEFYASKLAMVFHAGMREFSANMANLFYWPKKFQNHILGMIAPQSASTRFTMRWQGAMVGDVHRILTRGGLFIYPGDSRDIKQPAKLRLLYEAFPMALLIEAAGGCAYTEQGRILAASLNELHQRTPVILGDKTFVSECFTALSAAEKCIA